MNYRNNIYNNYNFDCSGKKIKYNNLNKKIFPPCLHKNIKNYEI